MKKINSSIKVFKTNLFRFGLFNVLGHVNLLLKSSDKKDLSMLVSIHSAGYGVASNLSNFLERSLMCTVTISFGSGFWIFWIILDYFGLFWIL